MKKSRLILVIALLLLFFVGAYFLKFNIDKRNYSKQNVLSVEQVAADPGSFKGEIKVTGTVIKIEGQNATFALGCEDACIKVPVKYPGEMPSEGSRIVAYGEIKQGQDGKYFFEAQEIQ